MPTLKERFTSLIICYLLPRPARLQLLERKVSTLTRGQGSAVFLRKYGLEAFGEMMDQADILRGYYRI